MNRRIVILGFMGCGKTTVARELARQLECDFVDLDSYITQRHGRSPAEIIEQDGEDSFREIETMALREVLQKDEARVVALGGGAWTIPSNRTLTAQHDCETVWLDVPFETCWHRIVKGESVRPLAPDRNAALSRFESRREHYALANRRLSVNESESVKAIAKRIASETQTQAK
jgi:shikimate kinase